jgi:hypothetical protein
MRIRLGATPCLLCAVVFSAQQAAPEAIEVRLEREALAVHTNGAPLASVLERIKQATGIELVFEGAPPRQLIRAQLRRPTIAAAIVDLMQGQSLSYAMQLDETGKKPLKLIVFTNVSRAAPSRPDRSFRPSPPMPEPEFEEPPEMELPEDEPPPPEGMVEIEPPMPRGAIPRGAIPEEMEAVPPMEQPMSPFAVVPLAPTPAPEKTPPD